MTPTAWILLALAGLVILALLFAVHRLRKTIREQSIDLARLTNRLHSVQTELRQINARRKKLLAASTQALMIVENDFTVSSANRTARQLFGKKPEKKPSLMAWTHHYQLQDLVERTLQGEKIPSIYFQSGSRYLEARARPIKHQKQIVAVALAVHDVTELQRLTRIRRDFVANISHELRTPVTSIQLLADTLKKGALKDTKMARRLVEKISAQADALNQMAQELMDLSLIESGQMPLKLGLYPLHSIVRTQIDRFSPFAERRKVTLHLDVSPGITVLADETMVGRVIGNLLHNGIKFTDAGGQVTISAGPADITTDPETGSWVTVRVSDTGVGIPPEEIGRIFERFYKIDHARDRKKSGTGLGLAIARHVVEAHGGRIWAKSDGVHGTTFFFTLPVEENGAPQVMEQTADGAEEA